MLLLFGLTLIAQICYSQSLTLQEHYAKARGAYQDKNFELAYYHITQASELHPYHQGILYHQALTAARMNKPEEAVALLQKVTLISTSFDLMTDDFSSLKERPDFQSVLDLHHLLNKPIINSETALIIADRQLHVEGIAAGINPGEFYVTSIHKRKVVHVSQNGTVTDFVTPGQDGLAAALSVKADRESGSLWIASSPLPEMMDYGSALTSALYQYDLRTKKMINRYVPEFNAKEFILGDLIVSTKGQVFVSDTKNNIIFNLNSSTGKLEPFFQSDTFWNIQGISFSNDERYLFIADYVKGVFRLEMNSKELIQIEMDCVASLKGIDGLLHYNNSLIAIQNGVQPMRVVQLFLNTARDRITSAKSIDHGHPAFNEPTNGCIVNNTLYYIANSQWNGYDNMRKIKPDNQLQDIIVLKAPLK
jgi:hypothetical protein